MLSRIFCYYFAYTMIQTLLAALLITILMVKPASAQNNTLPNIGSSGLSTLSFEKEKLLGDILMRQTRAQLPVNYDPLTQDYINTLGNQLITHADDIHFPFNFFTVRDPSINAFAFFGGNVAVNTGLIALADNESELASVVAHEIAHVTQRHLSRRFEEQSRNAPLTLASMLGGILLAVLSPEAGMAGIMAAQAGNMQAGINFTRANEQEADRIGIKILANAGFDPYGAPSFFDKLAGRFRYTSTPPQFLLTHPLPESRVAESRIRAQRYPKITKTPSFNFHLIKARIQVRHQMSSKNAINFFQKQLKTKSYTFEKAALYGLALAYSDEQQYQKAHSIITKLRSDDPDNLFYIDTYVDILNGQQQHQQALTLLAKIYKLKPNNAIITLNYASTALDAKQPQLAIDLLNSYRISHGQSYIAADLLVEAYKQQENSAKYHEMRAEVFALLSLYEQSIQELNLSIKKLRQQSDKDLEKKRLIALRKQYRKQLEQIKKL